MGHPANEVRVTNAPGSEDFTGFRIPGLEDEFKNWFVVHPDGGVRVIPSRCVESVCAAAYRKEWSTLTGRAPSDIYIPEAIR